MIPDSIVEERKLSPAQDERRKALVAAARESFFTDGYAGTAMSTIAARVGGSKTTLWAYFPSKQDLFAAVVDDVVETYGTALSIKLSQDEPLESELLRFAQAMMTTILSPPVLTLHRLVAGEAGRFPELGKMFFERGPKRGKAMLADFMAGAMKAQRLRTGDPMVAARQFVAMCQSGCFQRALHGCMDHIEPPMIEADIEAALDSFRRAWENPNANM